LARSRPAASTATPTRPTSAFSSATDAICTCGTYLFHDLGLRKLTAGLMGVNEQMLRVFLKLGFVVEGTRRQQDRFEDGYCDHIYLGCFADEFGFGRV
jgi:RimJ/RimL family protein N-acetyltransferase